MWFSSKKAAQRIADEANSRRTHDDWRYLVIHTERGWEVSVQRQ